MRGRHALVVGINVYQTFPEGSLKGAENDARLFSSLLETRFGFPRENIRLLLSRDATAEAIRGEFERRLVKPSKPGDQVVFFFSGHGSQVRDADGDEPDGYDEILCPTDIAVAPDGKIHNMVTDDELGELAKKLQGREFVAIFDCCHSGTGLRDIVSCGRARYLPLERAAPGSLRDIISSADIVAPLRTRPARQQYSEVVKTPGGHAALIAACLAGEKALETKLEVGGAEEVHGVLTVKLHRGLAGGDARVGGRITYRSLKEYLESPILTEGREQHPQFECDNEILDKEFVVSGDDASTPPLAEPMVSVSPLRVFVCSYRDLQGQRGEETGGDLPALSRLLQGQPFVSVAGSREDSDVAVFHADGGGVAGARHVLGTMLPSGGVTLRIAVDTLDEGAARPLVEELRRLYLVNNLMAMRNPGSGFNVRLALDPTCERPRKGGTIMFRVTAARDGYLTLVNIDCKGGINRLVPNDFVREYRLEAGKELIIPAGEFELNVADPLGREYCKAIVSSRPLSIPLFASARSIGGFRSIDRTVPPADWLGSVTRAIVPKARDQAGLETLKPDEWGEASLFFSTSE
jgi:hypothetical protein